MNDRLAVGVDAGGTSTVAAASQGGKPGSVVRGAPANPSSIGCERSAANIAATVREATGGEAPAALYVGAAGAGSAEVARRLETALREAFPETQYLTVTGDVECALRAAIPEGPGIVLIAGTGSVAYAENGAKRVRAGGYGYLAGDEGSAFAIGFAAVKLLARTYDGRAHADETTALAARALDCSDRDSLLAALYAAPIEVAKIAALAPSIVGFAGKGNRASTRIVQGAALELGDLLRNAALQAGLAEASPAIAFAGGLLRENSLLSFLLENRVTNEIPGAAIVRLRDEPASAALHFAEAMLA
jgi:N-acetylglucosamine kinase-like BadF-type ATPase